MTVEIRHPEKWDCESSEWKEPVKSMTEEILAIHEMIKLLNDDGALELFEATLTSLFRDARILVTLLDLFFPRTDFP